MLVEHRVAELERQLGRRGIVGGNKLFATIALTARARQRERSGELWRVATSQTVDVAAATRRRIVGNRLRRCNSGASIGGSVVGKGAADGDFELDLDLGILAGRAVPHKNNSELVHRLAFGVVDDKKTRARLLRLVATKHHAHQRRWWNHNETQLARNRFTIRNSQC